MIPTAEYHTKMLQIQRKMRGWNSNMLQNAVEIAASSSKMLQIAREMDRTGNPKKNPKRKNLIPQTFPDPFYSTPFAAHVMLPALLLSSLYCS